MKLTAHSLRSRRVVPVNRRKVFFACGRAILGASVVVLLASQFSQAANTTFTLTPSTNIWSTDTWSSSISGIAAGDIAQFNTAGTATTSLDVDVTLGQLQTGTTTGAIWSITGTTNTFTLDGTGITSGNQAFGNAGVAAIASRNTAGNLTIAPAISFGATALDIGATSTGTVTISGGITTTAAQVLNFRGSGSGIVTVNSAIGATGSAITINNLRSSGGNGVLSGNLGANVANIYQGSTSAANSGVSSTTSQLTLSGANGSFAGGIFLTVGQLNLSSTGAIGGATSIALNGGTTLNAAVASVTTAANPTLALNGNWVYSGNALNLGAGAVTLTGSNVGVITNTTNNLTIGGNITGSSSLTKTAQANGSFTNMGALILNGTNSYTGGTIIQQGQIQFGSAAAVPSTGKILLAGQGANSVAYEGAAAVFNFALSQTELGKVSSASVGTVALSVASSNALDFSSATGANLANVSLGAQTSSTYSGTLTPWTSANNGAYLLGGSGNQNASNNSILTVSSSLGDSGSVATGLIVDPTFVGYGAGSVTLTGVNTYTGRTLVNTGTLKLDFSGNAGTGVSNLISSSSALALANFATLNITGKSANTNSQTFNGLTLLGSNSTITATQNSATSLTANFGAITRNNNGTVTFSVVPTAGGFTTTNSVDSSSGGGILGPWATVGTGSATRYATKSGSNIIAYTGGTAAATGAALTDTTGTVNYDLAATGALAAAVSLNSIRYTSTSAAGSVDIGANNLTVNGMLNGGSTALTITTSSTGTVVIGSTRELVLNAAGAAIIVNAPIVDNAAGASSLTISGNSGSQYTVLQKASTYTGGTFINGNVAVQAASNGFGASTGLVTFSGGQLNAESTTITIANPIAFTQGTSTTLNPNSQTLTLTGAISGSGTMFVGDGGSFASLNLNGNMSGFTGTIIFNAGGGSGDNFAMGNLSAGNNNLSQTTLIGENAGSRRFNTGGGYLQVGSLEGSMTIIAGGTMQVGALNTNASFGGVTVTNNVGIVKVGTGTWTLNSAGGWGNNAGVTANNGTLLVDMSGLAIPTNFLASSTLTLNGGAVSVRGKATTLQNSSQAFSATTINAGSSTVALDNGGATNNTLVTLAAINRATTVGVSGGGTVNFVLPSGTQSSTNGITTISTANVLGGIMTQSGTNSVAYATVNQTDWAALSGNNIIALASYTTGSLAGNVDVTTSFTGAVSAAPNSLRFNTDGQTLTLDTGTQVVTGGILVTANSSSTGSVIAGNTLTTGGGREFVFIDYGKLTVASQLINNAGGSTMLTKSGTGTLFLTNTNNTYSGISYLNDGILNIAAAGSLGTSTAANAISFNGGTLQLAGAFDLASTQGINLGFKGGTFDTNSFSSTYSGAIASSSAVQGTTSENTGGQFGFTKTGSGTLTLTGTNSYAGATTILGGTLSVSYLDNATIAGNVTPGAAGGIGKSANYAKNLILNGGTLQYTGAAASTDRLFTLGDNGGGLDASGSGAINFSNTGAVGYAINSTGGFTNSSPTLTLSGTNSGANTLAASIGNNGLGTTAVTKSGAGKWVLTGASNYTGATAVNNGTLVVSGSLTGTLNVTVASAATLASGSSGTISTATGGNVSMSGALAPGDTGTVGSLTLAPGTGGKLSFLSGSTFKFDISGSNADLVTFATTGDWLGGSGNVTLALSGITASDYGNTYTVFQNVSTSGFAFTDVTGYDSTNYAANFAQVGSSYQLSFVAIPEPSAAFSLAGGLGMLLGLQRRRSRRRA